MNKYIIDFVLELIGTFIFIYVICTTGNYLAIGATLGILVLIISKYSFANFNPAVSISLFYQNKMTTTELFIVVIAEILGGLLVIPTL